MNSNKNWFSELIGSASARIRACWQHIKDTVVSIVAFFRRNGRLTDAHLVGGIVVFAISRIPVAGKYIAVLVLILAFAELVGRDNAQITEAAARPSEPGATARIANSAFERARAFLRMLERWTGAAARYIAARWLFFETVIAGAFVATLANAFIPWIGGALALTVFALAVLYGIERQVSADSTRVVFRCGYHDAR